MLGPDNLITETVIGEDQQELVDFPKTVNLYSMFRGGQSLCVYLLVSGQMNYVIGCSDSQLHMLCYKSL